MTGLTLGADDFLTKPFSLAVLRARVASLIRRSEITKEASGGASGENSLIYELDDMTFDFDKLIFTKGNEEIVLSVNEQRLLKIFLDNKGRVLTRNLLMDRLWGNDGEFVDENALSVTINRLRSKLEDGVGRNISVQYMVRATGLMINTQTDIRSRKSNIKSVLTIGDRKCLKIK